MNKCLNFTELLCTFKKSNVSIMKRIISTLFIFLTVLFLSSCAKKDYSVRFKNDYTETVQNVSAGNAYLGDVNPGKTSDYQSFTGSSFIISGMTVTGKKLNGTEAVSGKGTHKWTITLKKDGTFDFSEDQL